MSKYIKDNEISVSKKEWADLNQNHSKDEIKQILSDLIEDNNLPLPYAEISLEDAVEDFNKLKDMDCLDLIQEKEFFTRYDYNRQLSNTIINQSNVGNKSSNYFHQKSRWLCDSINAPSPYRTWTNEKFRLTLFNALWTLKFEEINNTNLRSAIGLRKYIAAQFKPSAAKAIYQLTQARSILDFSSGWGDRLSAFMACDHTERYVGIDPNARLVEGYQKQIDMFGQDKEIQMISDCAENLEFDPEQFDLVFTSPPYFDVERYTQEANQSWKKYKKLDSWLDSFLFNVLEKSFDSLKKNGKMLINISDVYCHHTIQNICDPMCDFLESLGLRYEGCMGLRLSKRPRSKSAVKDGIYGEPIWIFSKGG